MAAYKETVEEELNMADQLDSRVARLESDVHHIDTTLTDIKTDIRDIRIELRIAWGAIIASTLGLATMMAKGFRWL